MSFVIYIFVLLIGAASVLFGVDLLNSPLHSPPNVPIGRSIHNIGTEPAVHEPKGESEIKPAAQIHTVSEGMRRTATEKTQVHNPELTPIYPDHSEQASVTHPPRKPARRRASWDEQAGATQVDRGSPSGSVRHQIRHYDDLSETARIVRQMTHGRDQGDIVVQRGNGAIIIVHTGSTLAEQR
jgi:hypothetical protein